MANDIFKLHTVKHGTTFFDQLSSYGFDTGITELISRGRGGEYPLASRGGFATPRVSFSSRAIATILDNIVFTGQRIQSTDKLTCILAALQTYGTIQSGSVHRGIEIVNGLMSLGSLTASQDTPAEISVNAIGVSTDGSSPVAYLSSQALPTGSSSDQLFFAGPIDLDGSNAIDIASGFTVDFGMELEILRTDGHAFPKEVFIKTITPVVTIPNPSASLLSVVGDGGKQITNASLFLRKHSTDADMRVADATLQHIQFTIAEGYARVQNVQASLENQMGLEVVITATYDGSTQPIAIDTTAAIV